MHEETVRSTGEASQKNQPGWISPESYWIPNHIVDSAWLQHGAFAFWIVSALKPRIIVELGTHNGFSYFAFCESVQRIGLSTTCFALDTWQGDDHAGFYEEKVFDLVSTVNADKYSSFSTLLRGYFDESVAGFADGSIDLLHIDGRHGYDDAKHDFETWLPKLSSRAVVLFHDIAEHENGFEVWRLWEEISTQYPSFSFEFGHGLGVLGVGTQLPPLARELFDATSETVGEIRSTYEGLGGRIYGLYALLAERASLAVDLGIARNDLALARDETLSVRRTLAEVLSSTAWKTTKPLRVFASLVHGLKRPGSRRSK